ncbi:hypothetical protein H7J08_00550 [Mycobacterium frederiksbergense]|uniref:Uncharacterized protein n=1 Tax=Mycolicibacterium frederiksbergense TaxID=117567 RepID=A0A6H0SD33_9MYCO|nr:DUF5701 family protein [Mycolicibacterium frederiksbergense]MCV7043169.1 hypothetical protein [Mycolicibacterium frederiksbergense]QIV84481.1 hypothetical protein EXE63_29060 [Mycolicibacterium frederiksbergense]
MSLTDQLTALLDAGVAEAAAISADELRGYAAALPDEPGAVIAVHPRLAPARALAPLLRHDDKAGFVVTDLTDLEAFEPIAGVAIPDTPLYLVHDVDRGDDMRNWSPKESLPVIAERERTPLTICEGISWLLQEPKHLEANHCFMTIASRKRARQGLDARTPAIWISGGTGRDGVANRGAPKVGWCWAGNRHTWLGMASASRRSPL